MKVEAIFGLQREVIYAFLIISPFPHIIKLMRNSQCTKVNHGETI